VLVTPVLPLLAELPQIQLRVRQQALLRSNLGQPDQRVLVVMFDLERLLVEGRGFWQKAFVEQVIRDADELGDGPVLIAGADVQVTQRVNRIEVAWLVVGQADVFRDGSFESALAEQPFRRPQRRFTIYGHYWLLAIPDS
jgi:hypothetical protein